MGGSGNGAGPQQAPMGAAGPSDRPLARKKGPGARRRTDEQTQQHPSQHQQQRQPDGRPSAAGGAAEEDVIRLMEAALAHVAPAVVRVMNSLLGIGDGEQPLVQAHAGEAALGLAAMLRFLVTLFEAGEGEVLGAVSDARLAAALGTWP